MGFSEKLKKLGEDNERVLSPDQSDCQCDISRRSFFGVLSAGAASLGVALLAYKYGLFDSDDDIEKSIAEQLTPYIERNFNNVAFPPESVQQLQMSQIYYPRSLDLSEVERELKNVAANGYEGNTDEQNAYIKSFLGEIFDSGFFSKFQSLKHQNAGNLNTKNVVLIPMSHATFTQQDADYQIDACSEDIDNILRILNKKSIKIFMEGIVEGGRVDEDYLIQTTKEFFEIVGRPENYDAVLKASIENYKKSYPWLIDDDLEVFGWENKNLRVPISKFGMLMGKNGSYPKEAGAFSVRIFYYFVTLFREQYAAELALSNLQRDDTGVIVIGAAHVPTLYRYLADHHPFAKLDIIVPKHLF